MMFILLGVLPTLHYLTADNHDDHHEDLEDDHDDHNDHGADLLDSLLTDC